VEGYVESAASGLLCGLNAPRLMAGQPLLVPPPATALGGLITHLMNTEAKHFQPSNINFGLLPPLDKKYPKKERGRVQARRALANLMEWLSQAGIEPAQAPPEL
jgi:methylenetetrahydrofolate--tRNA-(uracil-5-)-methyltransferase